MTPKDILMQHIREATQFKSQAEQALYAGIYTNEARIISDLLVKGIVPHGMKGFARTVGRTVRRASKLHVNTH